MVEVETLFSEVLDCERDIYIFTPPDFSRRRSQRYPVLYMQDGQNIFSREGTWHIRWDVDGTAARLINRGKIEELIIVGVANSEWRDDEYTPTVDEGEESGGLADPYLRFLVEEVKPYIDQNYPVRPFREDTGIAGSSLGGLLSLYAAMTYPEYFGKVAAMSPSLWWDDHVILKMATEWEVDPTEMKIWLDMGFFEDDPEEAEEEDVDPLEEAAALCEILKEKGFRRGRSLRYFEDKSGTHDEIAWGRRFSKVLRFLYGT